MTVGELLEDLSEYAPEEHIVIGGGHDADLRDTPMFEIESVYEKNSHTPGGLVVTIGIVPGKRIDANP